MKKISITRKIGHKGKLDWDDEIRNYSGESVGNAKQEYMRKLSGHRQNQNSFQ